jgi:hypothetical protein
VVSDEQKVVFAGRIAVISYKEKISYAEIKEMLLNKQNMDCSAEGTDSL